MLTATLTAKTTTTANLFNLIHPLVDFFLILPSKFLVAIRGSVGINAALKYRRKMPFCVQK